MKISVTGKAIKRGCHGPECCPIYEAMYKAGFRNHPVSMDGFYVEKEFYFWENLKLRNVKHWIYDFDLGYTVFPFDFNLSAELLINK